MSHPDPQAAAAIDAAAREIADAASRRLIARQAGIHDRFGTGAQRIWTDHLHQRVLELSAALAAGEPKMFSSKVEWSRGAMSARGLAHGDLEVSLVCLREELENILTGEARQASIECMDAALGELKTAVWDPTHSMLDAGLPHDRLALAYIQAVVSGNVHQSMESVLDALDDWLEVPDAFTRVLLPAQMEVGRLWHLDKLTVAEEHLVSFTTVRLMAVLASRAQRADDLGLTAVCASVAGNAHDIGIRAIAYLMEFQGWRSIYLGADMPRRELARSVAFYDADLVMLSLALSSQIPTLKRTMAAIREESPETKILVGGGGLIGAADLWQEVGADGFAANADAALIAALEVLDD